jgi:hypothetical protein
VQQSARIKGLDGDSSQLQRHDAQIHNRQIKDSATGEDAGPPPRAKKPDAIDTLVAANAKALALPIDPAWRPAITLNLQVLFKHAKIVDEFSLPDDIDRAPVFRA